MNPKAPLPKWEWGDENTPPAEPSAEERALSEIEHALRMFTFGGRQTKQSLNTQLKKDAS
jgi:hypothetical protein